MADEKLVRAVGFWGLVALCINAVVGSSVFLFPSESFQFLGQFSLWAPLIFALPVFVLVLCFAEAASHFQQPGGAYLYAKTAFGDFVGFETGWMNTIARITSLAALANGVVVTLARLVPGAADGAQRSLIIVGTMVTFATIHILGIRYGARAIYLFTLGKLVPLVVFIVVAVPSFRINPLPGSMDVSGVTNWADASLLLLFAYAGFENLAIPAGEYKNPKRDLPLALLFGTLGIAALYALTQFGTMSTIADLGATKTPVADAAGVLLGGAGVLLVTVGAVLSILGTNLGTMLEGSRMVYAVSQGRRGLSALSWVHPRFRTPTWAIVLLTVIATPMAIAGSFKTLALLSAGARLTTYLFTCAALPRLRKLSDGGGWRYRGAAVVGWLGVTISLALIVIQPKEKLIAAAIAIAIGAIVWFATRPRGAEASAAGV